MDEKVESLPEALCYKQRLEKSTGAEMFLMKWSTVADLLVAAYTDHSVSVQSHHDTVGTTAQRSATFDVKCSDCKGIVVC